MAEAKTIRVEITDTVEDTYAKPVVNDKTGGAELAYRTDSFKQGEKVNLPALQAARLIRLKCAKKL